MTEQEIIERLTAVFKNRRAFTIGKVVAVTGNTCEVKPLNGDENLTGVRLSFEEPANHMLTPAKDSIVVAGFRYINKMQTEVFVVYSSKYSKYKMITEEGSTEYSMAKTEELITQLNKTNATVKALVKAIITSAVTPGDGGATYKANMASVLSAVEYGDFSEIKNENFKHG